MKFSRFFRASIATLTCCGMLSAQIAQAAGTPTTQPTPASQQTAPSIRDVALQDRGELRGQVLDAQGAPSVDTPVIVVRQGQEVARTQTDVKGMFVVQGLTGGVYEFATPQGSAVYRAWSPRTAPPAAGQVAVVNSEQTIVRGQWGTSALGWLANPWVLAAIVAAAIAIPLALDNDDAS